MKPTKTFMDLGLGTDEQQEVGRLVELWWNELDLRGFWVLMDPQLYISADFRDFGVRVRLSCRVPDATLIHSPEATWVNLENLIPCGIESKEVNLLMKLMLKELWEHELEEGVLNRSGEYLFSHPHDRQ